MEKVQQRQIASRDLIKSKQRVADHGEVFTPGWLVETMLDLVKDETSRIESRFLEPACGTGNFLVRILRRKFAAVELKYGRSGVERRNIALFALMCTYGIEVLKDNITECRTNMLYVFADFLKIKETDDFYRAASYILLLNVVHGNSLEMRTYDDKPITFVEWEYIGNGKFQRRDFRLDVLAQSSIFIAGDSVFAKNEREALKPTKIHSPITVRELSRAATGRTPRGIA